MNINKKIKIVDLALYLTKSKTLIIADSHIGFEESLNKQGLLVPRLHFKDLIQRMEKILKEVKPNTIIINGDIKHELGTISEQEWRYALRLIDFLSKHCKNLFLIKGNHDKILGPIAKKRNIEIADQIIIDDILITHGHKIIKIPKQVKTIIIGHEHPAIGLREQTRTETFKCFLKGKYKSKTLIVQPSFNLVTEGTDITKEKTLSPFLKQDLRNFECYIVADKIYRFGKLRNLSR
ncbi:metallophosphoesterase [Candidatus Woesearchaeota archaeon]|nr:metallophosphoesterase [Candidatus Woesearchaeota archaeon]